MRVKRVEASRRSHRHREKLRKDGTAPTVRGEMWAGKGQLAHAWLSSHGLGGEELTLQKQQHEDRCGQGCQAY